jgi:anthraniloyl-CoA monooxygenase
MEDAIELQKQFRFNANVPEALVEFESARRPVIEDYQAAAYESMLWFENARQHMNLSPIELAFTLMTRSGRVNYEDLKKRDPEFIRRLGISRGL